MTTEATLNRRSNESDGSVLLSGRRLLLARSAWAMVTLAGIGLFVAGLPLHYRTLLSACTAGDCAAGQLTPATMQALQEAGIDPAAYATYLVGLSVLVAVVHCAVGLLIVWRQSRERMALLASLWLITLGLTLTEGEVRALAAAYPALQLPALALIWLGGVVLLVLFMFTFPDGRFVPGWSRWLYPLVVLAMALIVALQSAGGGEPLVELWGLMILGGITAQVYRYLRVSGPVQRQQTKWVMAGLLLLAGAVAFLFVYDSARWMLGSVDLDEAVTLLVNTTVASLAFLVIPVTVAFSVLRYRLWDTDRLINRTLVYGLLTAVLVLLYFSSVVLLQQ
ncbi:MAG: hypothetical protein R3300_13420, partial [Candidatus Promineifilaceae bacterium]|nr:hypothetical protein [Candidatus Promineifilaceae bacterium]